MELFRKCSGRYSATAGWDGGRRAAGGTGPREVLVHTATVSIPKWGSTQSRYQG